MKPAVKNLSKNQKPPEADFLNGQKGKMLPHGSWHLPGGSDHLNLAISLLQLTLLHRGKPVEGAVFTPATCLLGSLQVVKRLLLISKDQEHFIPREIAPVCPGPSFD